MSCDDEVNNLAVKAAEYLNSVLKEDSKALGDLMRANRVTDKRHAEVLSALSLINGILLHATGGSSFVMAFYNQDNKLVEFVPRHKDGELSACGMPNPRGAVASASGLPRCSWCEKRALFVGEDGTYSCGEGMYSDVSEPHDAVGVLYTPIGQEKE